MPPTGFQGLEADIVALYDQLQTFAVEDIARRIAKMDYVTDTAAYQAKVLQQAGMHREAIKRKLAKLLNKTEPQIETMLQDAAVETLSEDQYYYLLAGKDAAPVVLTARMVSVLRAEAQKTNRNLKNLTSTTAPASEQAFIDAATRAYMQVRTGVLDYNTAVRFAVRDLADKGLQVVNYKTGHRDKIDVAARRAVLTGVNQTCGQMQISRAQDKGCDLMEITAHAGARPEHAVWQGRIVSLSGRAGYLSLSDIGYGDVRGFMGANCRHTWHPYFEGISRPMYTKAELSRLQSETVAYNGQKIPLYKAYEKQRAMERGIRAQKRRLTAIDGTIQGSKDEAFIAAQKQEFAAQSIRLKSKEAALKDLCKQIGTYTDTARTQVYGFGRSMSQKAVWASKKGIQNRDAS